MRQMSSTAGLQGSLDANDAALCTVCADSEGRKLSLARTAVLTLCDCASLFICHMEIVLRMDDCRC